MKDIIKKDLDNKTDKRENGNDLHLICMDDVEAKEVEWLWYPYIPYGKLTIVQGDPGEGKTTMVLQLAALLSKGEPLPGEDKAAESDAPVKEPAGQCDLPDGRGRTGRYRQAEAGICRSGL